MPNQETFFNPYSEIPFFCFGKDGIFYATGSEAISYPEQGNEACFQIEDQSFWFRHWNDCIRELVRSFPPRGH